MLKFFRFFVLFILFFRFVCSIFSHSLIFHHPLFYCFCIYFYFFSIFSCGVWGWIWHSHVASRWTSRVSDNSVGSRHRRRSSRNRSSRCRAGKVPLSPGTHTPHPPAHSTLNACSDKVGAPPYAELVVKLCEMPLLREKFHWDDGRPCLARPVEGVWSRKEQCVAAKTDEEPTLAWPAWD